MRFMFATWPAVEYQADVLTELGASNRLISYYFSRNETSAFMEDYVRKGRGPSKLKKGEREKPLLEE